MTSNEFLTCLDGAIARRAMLSHPFYKLWSEGALDRQTLGEYAVQYYAHVAAFPAYVSAVHSHCDDIQLRQALLENLIEEERGAENHPELWLRFAESLGVPRETVASAPLLPATRESVATMKRLTHSGDPLCGVAALYAYESQIPAVAETKRRGLEEFYGLNADRAVQFFRVHESADIIHRQVERDALAACGGDARQRAAIAAADEAAGALWRFLDGVHAAFVR